MISKIVSASGERSISEVSSEVQRLGFVDTRYKPVDQSEIEKLYAPVEPSGLISKGQTTSVYLT